MAMAGRAIRACPLLVLGACIGPGSTVQRAVPTDELAGLEAEYAADPANPRLAERMAISLVAADRCDEASEIARTADLFSTAAVSWPTLVQGRCRELAGEPEEARGFYRAYLSRNPISTGGPAVRGRLLLIDQEIEATDVRRRLASAVGSPPPNSALAVLPMAVIGDEEYASIARGLAARISADLMTLTRFQMVPRSRLDAVIARLDLTVESGLDTGTSTRLARVVQAGRMVDGRATLRSDGRASLEANIVGLDGRRTPVETQAGPIEGLLRLQKQFVFAISRSLGYEVTATERDRILRNGPQSLEAFLIYSDGLAAQALGEYEDAARLFGRAWQVDRTFLDARREAEASAGASAAVDRPMADLGTLVAEAAVRADAALGQGAVGTVSAGAMAAALGDVASTQSEQIIRRVGSGATPYISVTRGSPSGLLYVTPVTVTITIRIPGS